MFVKLHEQKHPTTTFLHEDKMPWKMMDHLQIDNANLTLNLRLP